METFVGEKNVYTVSKTTNIINNYTKFTNSTCLFSDDWYSLSKYAKLYT